MSVTEDALNADPAQIAAAIDAALLARADPDRAGQERRYLKSSLQHYGVRVPDTRRVVRDVLAQAPALDREQSLALVAQLWDGPVFDRRRAAVAVLVRHVDLLECCDLGEVERLVRDSATWALVDEIAISVAGPVLAAHGTDPPCRRTVQRWAVDPDFWVRRTLLLSPLLQVRALPREPEPLEEAQAALLSEWEACASGMVEEREFFIRKAIGWVLRDISRRRPTWVREWLDRYGERASGVTRREAVKYLTE